MNAIIVTNGTAEEIAALVLAVQERQDCEYLAARKKAMDNVQSRSGGPPCHQ